MTGEQNSNIAFQEEHHLLKEKFHSLQPKYATLAERNKLIDEDNKHKSILYAAALDRIHSLEEDNQLLKTKIDAAEEHHRTATTTQADNQDLRKQVETLQSRHAAELERNQTEQKELRRQLENSKALQEAALHQNHQNSAENETLQRQHAAALRETNQILTLTQTEKQKLQNEVEILQTQHVATLAKNGKIAASLQQAKQELQDRVQETHRYRSELAAVTKIQANALRHLLSEIRRDAATQTQALQEQVDYYTTQFNLLATATQQKATPDRIKELAKIEAFDLWVHRSPEAAEQISAQTLLHRVTTKLNHTLRTLKDELHQTTTERDELQTRLEQHEEETYYPYAWEQLLGFRNIEDPGNAITVTMKNLAPPISIFQYYQAYKPMILTWSALPDIRNKTNLSQEQFQKLWNKANSAAKDLLVFMWVLKDLFIPKGVVEITTANSPFYLTRFCISALTHINRHHEEFYSNMENRNSLPQLEPYDLEMVKEIQDMANSQFPEFLSALDNLAGEDTTLFHEASQQHQNLCKKFPYSFPQNFHRIQLNGYITRALEDRKHTLEQRIVSTPHSCTLLYLPQYDPGTMKIPKRSWGQDLNLGRG